MAERWFSSQHFVNYDSERPEFFLSKMLKFGLNEEKQTKDRLINHGSLSRSQVRHILEFYFKNLCEISFFSRKQKERNGYPQNDEVLWPSIPNSVIPPVDVTPIFDNPKSAIFM